PPRGRHTAFRLAQPRTSCSRSPHRSRNVVGGCFAAWAQRGRAPSEHASAFLCRLVCHQSSRTSFARERHDGGRAVTERSAIGSWFRRSVGAALLVKALAATASTPVRASDEQRGI